MAHVVKSRVSNSKLERAPALQPADLFYIVYLYYTILHCNLPACLMIQPRVCGDYLPPSMIEYVTCDTTPRMRGLRLICPSRVPATRYNPAYAGTTPQPRPRERHRAIQPRVCGDYTAARHFSFDVFDTTPRMRGLPRPHDPTGRAGRYNPAYAGTTYSISVSANRVWIQPRVCGDYKNQG